MKVSVITICYNNQSEIRQTIESVINQSHSDLEYIVIDGDSKDRSLQIINEYKDHISKIISEPDKGIYDALNKGIKNATGEIVGFIHAGDKLFAYDVIERISIFFENNDVDISYGGSMSINEEGMVVRVNKGIKKHYNWAIQTGWMPSHMSIYAKKSVYDKFGVFRLDIGSAADYEWFLRCFVIHRFELKIMLLNEFILYFSLGGVSSKDGIKKLTIDKRDIMLKKCWTVNGLKPPIALSKIKAIWSLRILLRCKYEKLIGRL